MSFQISWIYGRGYSEAIRASRSDVISCRIQDDREICFSWEPGDTVVVQDYRDDAMSYRIGGNRKAGYTLYHCGARPPYRKTGMPLSVTVVGPHPTLHEAIRKLVIQFREDWKFLNLDPIPIYGRHNSSMRGWETLYRRVCKAWGVEPTGPERPEPRRALPPHLRCQMAQADAAELAEELERAEKAARAEDSNMPADYLEPLLSGWAGKVAEAEDGL